MKLVSSQLVGSSRLFINVLLSRLLFSAQTIYTFLPRQYGDNIFWMSALCSEIPVYQWYF